MAEGRMVKTMQRKRDESPARLTPFYFPRANTNRGILSHAESAPVRFLEAAQCMIFAVKGYLPVALTGARCLFGRWLSSHFVCFSVSALTHCQVELLR